MKKESIESVFKSQLEGYQVQAPDGMFDKVMDARKGNKNGIAFWKLAVAGLIVMISGASWWVLESNSNQADNAAQVVQTDLAENDIKGSNDQQVSTQTNPEVNNPKGSSNSDNVRGNQPESGDEVDEVNGQSSSVSTLINNSGSSQNPQGTLNQNNNGSNNLAPTEGIIRSSEHQTDVILDDENSEFEQFTLGQIIPESILFTELQKEVSGLENENATPLKVAAITEQNEIQTRRNNRVLSADIYYGLGLNSLWVQNGTQQEINRSAAKSAKTYTYGVRVNYLVNNQWMFHLGLSQNILTDKLESSGTHKVEQEIIESKTVVIRSRTEPPRYVTIQDTLRWEDEKAFGFNHTNTYKTFSIPVGISLMKFTPKFTYSLGLGSHIDLVSTSKRKVVNDQYQLVETQVSHALIRPYINGSAAYRLGSRISVFVEPTLFMQSGMNSVDNDLATGRMWGWNCKGGLRFDLR